MDREIKKFIEERGVDLTIPQQEQVLKIIGMMVAAGKSTSAKKLSPIIDKLLECDPEVTYAIVVLMPMQSLNCFVDCSDDRFKVSVNKITTFIEEKKQKDSVDKTLGGGI